MVCDEYSDTFERVVNGIIDYMYIVFGPVLFIFCMFGLVTLPGLSASCTEISGDHFNMMDVFILVMCTALSGLIVFIYSLQRTNTLAEKDLANEHSVFYQVFISYLRKSRAKYHEERRRRLSRRDADQNPVGENSGE